MESVCVRVCVCVCVCRGVSDAEDLKSWRAEGEGR